MACPSSPRSSSSNISVDELNYSIKEQVHAAVTRFAGMIASEQSENEFLEPTELGSRQTTLEKLEKEKRDYEEQLARLQEEVELMEDEVRRREGGEEVETDTEMERELFGLARSNLQKEDKRGEGEGEGDRESAKGVATSREHEKNIRNLKAWIKLNEAFNGIQFVSAEWEIVAKDDNSLHRKHVHVGSAHGLKFQVEFLVREIEGPDSSKNGPPVQARIIALSVTVDPRIEADLEVFTARVCMDLDLMKFYQTYVKYAILVNERREAFSTAKSKYGECVEVLDGVEQTRLTFRLKLGLSLFFSWSVSVSERGFVDSSLGLQVKCHSKVSDGDRETVSHLPRLLQKMVRIHGHREALLSVLALLQPTCT